MKKFITITICFLYVGLTYAQNVHIIPTPQEIIEGKGTFILNNDVKLVCVSKENTATTFLQCALNKRLNSSVQVVSKAKRNAASIHFIIDKNYAEEAYKLDVKPGRINITANSETGWFYGVQSLLQLIPNQENQTNISIQEVTIIDEPRFSWRAFMLDESRYFKGTKQVKLLLDEMARLKMNIFHWHLVDDQGWRIEIKKYPLLTEVGSKRTSSQVGGWNSPIQSAEAHEGFYTQDEIKEIIQYANERHITIVPEIEMPGHSSAAIAAYPWLGTSKKQIEVPITFGKHEDVYDVSDPRVYEFLCDVIDEVIELFPSKTIHIGGDEVKYQHWKESKQVKQFMFENKLNSPAELQIFFTNKMSQYISSKGRKMMGWNEILGHNVHGYQSQDDTHTEQELAKETLIHFWKGDIKLMEQAALDGFSVVNSLHSNTYLDYSYNSIPLSKAYAFDPVPKNLAPELHNKIIGTGCQMWGEWIPSDGQMHFMVFPRIAAFAEVGWTLPKNKNFEQFKVGLKNLQQQWTEKGIYYAPDSAVEKKTKKKLSNETTM